MGLHTFSPDRFEINLLAASWTAARVRMMHMLRWALLRNPLVLPPGRDISPHSARFVVPRGRLARGELDHNEFMRVAECFLSINRQA